MILSKVVLTVKIDKSKEQLMIKQKPITRMSFHCSIVLKVLKVLKKRAMKKKLNYEK